MSVHGPVVFQALSSEECLEYLARKPVGRIAVSVQALPVILPVNYVMREGDVVFRTNSGTKLAAATAGTVVAFEVDHYDHNGRNGWSVLIQGRAAEIVRPRRDGRGAATPPPRLGARRFGRSLRSHSLDDDQRSSVPTGGARRAIRHVDQRTLNPPASDRTGDDREPAIRGLRCPGMNRQRAALFRASSMAVEMSSPMPWTRTLHPTPCFQST